MSGKQPAAIGGGQHTARTHSAGLRPRYPAFMCTGSLALLKRSSELKPAGPFPAQNAQRHCLGPSAEQTAGEDSFISQEFKCASVQEHDQVGSHYC